jgi:hypothetical protein
MNINQKIGIAVIAMLLLPLNINTSPATARLFSPCSENNRGIGTVEGTSSKDSVSLYWSAPDFLFQSILVCYKKSWGLSGKCKTTNAIKNYGVPVSQGTIDIPGLDSNTCYKFAVYESPTAGQTNERGRLIGEEKLTTLK